MKSIIFSTLLFSFSSLFAQETVSNADLARKLDLIIKKVSGLEERVSKLENASSEVKKEIQEVQQVAKDAKTATQAITLPENS
jgi:low affinity Fe/Cu permease